MDTDYGSKSILDKRIINEFLRGTRMLDETIIHMMDNLFICNLHFYETRILPVQRLSYVGVGTGEGS